jgi:signal transduction histidine kinase
VTARRLSPGALTTWTTLGLLVAATTVAIALADAGAGSMLRHLYAVPTVWGALQFGRRGGAGIASLAVLLDAPLLLRGIETWGLDRAAGEQIIALASLLVLGGLAGSLVDRARRQIDRYETALALQRSISATTPLSEGLTLANHALERVLRADQVEIVVRRDGETWVGAEGLRGLAAGTAGQWVATRAHSFHLPDAPSAGAATRPRRVFVVRLVAGGRLIGVAGARRAGWFSRDDRAALEALGVQVALAVENAALAADLEAKVAAATERLRELDRAKSELVSIASHELRTPLTSLRGFSELLLSRRYGETETRRFVSMIHSEAERLARLVDNLLDLARIERGQRLELRREPVAVRPLLEATAVRFAAHGATRRFRVIAESGLPPLLGDADAVERVLANLVANAVKYSPDGSEIRLRGGRSPDGFVELTVEDEGAGIPEASLPRIFDRYYRVSRPDSAARGLGLGLALVKSLVEAHGGAVRVESTPGVGSRFTVSLPSLP